ncbi:hypothetical protein BBW65_06970 [Helicobacter enhydrae]|uniref:Uncharacterized protein n=1 Tax=Helicobacter enhydrae TaxID=222136 RepID=A0A1B1U727_9HELI|nr:hypothetical protein [Helicobacter enhydrae]ANV98550.1 hypothetical protein BBW65_06970 [Helicobacter enhydrae]
MSVETEVAQTLSAINEVLREVAKEKIDPSVYTEVLGSFVEEKKRELQGVVDRVNDPLGEKTITMETIGKQRAIAGAYVYQEVWKKDGRITRYGDFILIGYCDDNMLGVNADGGKSLRVPLPNDVEFERLVVGYHNLYAIPKAGQSNVGGVEGSLDCCLFCMGYGVYGQLGKGSTSDSLVPYVHTFESRVKKLLVSGHGTDIRTGCFALLENKKVFVCGNQPEGYFGIGNTSQVNAWVQAHEGVDDIFVSPFDCWIIKSGVVYAMGWNGVGQLGCNSSGQKHTPVQIKAGVREAFIQCFAEYQNDWYVSAFMMFDGVLWAAGRNSHYQFSANNTSDSNALVRVTDGNGLPLNTPRGTRFLNHPLLTVILIPNNGDTDVYVSGYGEYGFGDGSCDRATKLKKIKTLSGVGWELDSNFGSDNYQDSIDCVFIIHKEKQEIWAWGYNGYGELGIGKKGGEEMTMTKVCLPRKGLKQFEAWACFAADNTGGLCVIVDGVLYACGNNIHQRLSRVSPILSPVARA